MAAESPKNIGWVGLGIMGYPMAGNLLKKLSPDTHFHVYDVSHESIDRFVGDDVDRVHPCASSKEVADKSDIIISMVPEGSHVRAVYLDPTHGVLSVASLGSKILIDSSTIDTGTSLAVRDACASQHPSASFYDAPVSGGALGASKASLTFMLGCSSTDSNLPLLTTLLSNLGSNIFPCGGPSLGLTAKLCNNYCSALITLATSDAMNIGMAAGMDPRVLANVFHTSTAQSTICDDWNPVPGLCPEAPASNGYQGGFRIGLMRKDIGLAVNTAERVGVKLGLGEQGLKLYDEAMRDPACEGLDSRVVYRYLNGREEWRDGFIDNVDMVRDETRRLLKLSKEIGR